MSSKNIKDVRVVVLSEDKIRNELGFLFNIMGQGAVTTYLIRHPEEVEKGVELAGVEVEVYGESFDLLFRKDYAYFVVEIKRNALRRKGSPIGKRKVQRYAEKFGNLLIQNGQKYQFIEPVLVVTE